MSKYDMKEVERLYGMLTEEEKVISVDEIRSRIDEIYELSEDLKDFISDQAGVLLDKVCDCEFDEIAESECGGGRWDELVELYDELEELGRSERWDRMLRIIELK